MANDRKMYDIVQPFTYMRDGKEVTRWQRVGTAFPKLEGSEIVGFTLRFTTSPPYPAMVVVAKRQEKSERTAAKEPDFDKEAGDNSNTTEDIPF